MGTLITDLLSEEIAMAFYVSNGVGGITAADIEEWAKEHGVMRTGTYDPNTDGVVTHAALSDSSRDSDKLGGNSPEYYQKNLGPESDDLGGIFCWYKDQAAYCPDIYVDRKLESIKLTTGTVVLGRDPQEDMEAVTRQYVDSVLQGFRIIDPVRVTTDDNVDLGVGGYLLIDGILLGSGDRVLLRGQTDPVENGVYDVNNGAWARSEDMKNSTLPEPSSGMYMFVTDGNLHGDTGYVLITPDPFVVGTDELSFRLFSTTSRNYFAGNGLDLSSDRIFSLDYGETTSPVSSVVVAGIDASGISPEAARIDHSHFHGQLIGGSLHDAVTASMDGFMSASDKNKLDAIEIGEVLNKNAYSYVTDGIMTLSADSVQGTLHFGRGIDIAPASPFPGAEIVVGISSGSIGQVLGTIEGAQSLPSVSWVDFALTSLKDFPATMGGHAGKSLVVSADETTLEYTDPAGLTNQNAYSEFYAPYYSSPTLDAGSITDTANLGAGITVRNLDTSGSATLMGIGIIEASEAGQALMSESKSGASYPEWRKITSEDIDGIPKDYFLVLPKTIKGRPYGWYGGVPEDLTVGQVRQILKDSSDATVYSGTIAVEDVNNLVHSLVFVNGILESYTSA